MDNTQQKLKYKDTLRSTHVRLRELSTLIGFNIQALGPGARYEPSYIEDIRSTLDAIANDLISLKH